MRVLGYLGVLIGLALCGLGLWMLFARFVGGPDYYLGRPDERKLREVEEDLARAKATRAELDEAATKLRASLDQIKDGEDRAEAEQVLIKVKKDRPELDRSIARLEEIRDGLARQRDAEWDRYHGRHLRRGILFTLVGALWTARAVGYVRRAGRRAGDEDGVPAGPSS